MREKRLEGEAKLAVALEGEGGTGGAAMGLSETGKAKGLSGKRWTKAEDEACPATTGSSTHPHSPWRLRSEVPEPHAMPPAHR